MRPKIARSVLIGNRSGSTMHSSDKEMKSYLSQGIHYQASQMEASVKFHIKFSVICTGELRIL